MLRPVQILQEKTKPHQNLNKIVNELRSARSHEIANWPDYCFIPISIWQTLLEKTPCDLDTKNRMELELSALGAWRYKQGIYSFNEELQKALSETEVAGELPADVLCHLPEWCIYVETPGMFWDGYPLYGFWAWVDFNTSTQTPV